MAARGGHSGSWWWYDFNRTGRADCVLNLRYGFFQDQRPCRPTAGIFV